MAMVPRHRYHLALNITISVLDFQPLDLVRWKGMCEYTMWTAMYLQRQGNVMYTMLANK